MESTTLTNTIGLFLTSILLLFSNISFACLDYEQSETIRLSLFKAELPGMEGFRPFYYCANAFNGGYGDSQSNGDTKKNCKEWQDYLGKSVSIKDIEFILYQTTPDVFEKAFQQGTLLTVFEGNTFIKILCSKRYNPELKYLRFLK